MDLTDDVDKRSAALLLAKLRSSLELIPDSDESS